MSQTWTDNPFASGNVGQTDLQNMENNFLALKSMFSGAGAPANAVAGMLWHDTGNNLIKCYYGAAWVTVYDLANERAVMALDLERTITGGTGLSGGGQLNQNQTLDHASHTGDVTGATALTIADNAVTPEKTSHGGLVVASDSQNFSAMTNTSYVTKLFYVVKCPSGPTALRFYARIKNATSNKDTYCRMDVDTLGNVVIQNDSTTKTWRDGGTVDMSGATPGTVYEITIDIKVESGGSGNLEGMMIWWE